MRKSSNLILLAMVCAVAVSSACGSRNLSRSKAAELIRNDNHLCLFSHLDTSFDAGYATEVVDAGWNWEPTQPVLRALRDWGFVEVKPTGARFDKGWGGKTAGFNITLTQQGKNAGLYLGELNSSQGFAPMARLEFVGVTGIRQTGKSAVVEYTVHYVPTALGQKVIATRAQGFGPQADPNKLEKCEATLDLYDDGWRVRR